MTILANVVQKRLIAILVNDVKLFYKITAIKLYNVIFLLTATVKNNIIFEEKLDFGSILKSHLNIVFLNEDVSYDKT